MAYGPATLQTIATATAIFDHNLHRRASTHYSISQIANTPGRAQDCHGAVIDSISTNQIAAADFFYETNRDRLKPSLSRFGSARASATLLQAGHLPRPHN